MSIFFHTIKLSVQQRRRISAIVAVLLLTSSHVQAASAQELLPAAVIPQTNLASENDDVPDGLVVPKGPDVKASETKPAEKPIVPKPAKKAWNRVNAPDLETVPGRSDEPAARTMIVTTTAYNSEPGQTDSTPFTTANGTRVRDGIVAANFLKFGTRIRIPEYFGDKVFEVHDRMNARYTSRVDIWMLNKADAKAWGVRRVKIEILP